MILSHRHRFIFVRTRKTASSSTEIALSSVTGPDDVLTPIMEEHLRPEHGAKNYVVPWSKRTPYGRFRTAFGSRKAKYLGYHNHITAAEIRALAGEAVWDGYFKFAVERNPWDRQVSHYHWELRKKAEPPSFETFLRTPSLKPQMSNWQIYTIDDRIAVDRVIAFDRLEAGLAEVADQLGIAPLPALGRAKSDTRQRRDYRDYYTDETRALVGRWYEREIDAFGFTF